jgi:hypothetical protein
LSHALCSQSRLTFRSALLGGFYAPQNSSFLPTFRDNQSLPSSGVKQSLKDGTDRLSQMSARHYQSTQRKIPPKERRTHLHRGGSLKPRIAQLYKITNFFIFYPDDGKLNLNRNVQYIVITWCVYELQSNPEVCRLHNFVVIDN